METHAVAVKLGKFRANTTEIRLTLRLLEGFLPDETNTHVRWCRGLVFKAYG